MSRRGFPQVEWATERASAQYSPINGAIFTPYTLEWTPSYKRWDAESVGGGSPGYPTNKDENGYYGWKSRVSMTPANVKGTVGLPTPHTRVEGTYPMYYLSGAFDPITQYSDDTAFTDAYNRCESFLIKRIKDQKVNLGIVAAEFNRTCRTVSDSARRIAQAFQQVKKGNIGGGVNTLLGGRAGSRSSGGGRNSHGGRERPKDPRFRPKVPPNSGSVAKDWLAIQYGWLPLLSDVNGAVEELARTMTYRPPVGRVTATGKASTTVQRTIQPQTNWLPAVVGTRKVNCSARGFIEYRVSNQLAQIAANTGVANPLSVLWEVIPYSFVVDWFLPVGNYLNNLDYDLGVEFSRGSIGVKSEGTWKIKAQPGTHSASDITETWSGGSIDASTEYFRRFPLSGFPELRPPSFKDPRSLKRVANAISLLRVAFGR